MGVRRAAVSVAGGASVLAGDVIGPSGANTVVGLQTRPVNGTAPASGDVLQFNGSEWIPATVAGIGQPVGWSKTVYVDPNKGNDSTGILADASKPFQTMQKAWEHLQSNGVERGSMSLYAGPVNSYTHVDYAASGYGEGRGITVVEGTGGNDAVKNRYSFTWSECSFNIDSAHAFSCNAAEPGQNATLINVETLCTGVNEDILFENFEKISLNNVKTRTGTAIYNALEVSVFDHEENDGVFNVQGPSGNSYVVRARNSTFYIFRCKDKGNVVLADDCVVQRNVELDSIADGNVSVFGRVYSDVYVNPAGGPVVVGARIGGSLSISPSEGAPVYLVGDFAAQSVIIGAGSVLDCTQMNGTLNPSTTSIGLASSIVNPRWMTFDTVNDAALNHNATLTESLVGMTNTNIGRTFVLPGDARPGQQFGVKDRAGTAGAANKHITVTDALSRSIDGASSILVNKNWQTIWFEYDVSTDKWMVISST